MYNVKSVYYSPHILLLVPRFHKLGKPEIQNRELIQVKLVLTKSADLFDLLGELWEGSLEHRKSGTIQKLTP